MKTLSTTLIAVTISLLAATPVFASQGGGYGMKHGNIHERLERQHYRIKSGVRNDQLTRKEAKTLKQHQRDIRYLLRLFSEDGRLSKKERRILNRELSQSSRQIKRLKHNDLERYVELHQRYDRSHHGHKL
jgi:translation initiation factor 2 beta subunit (eIF-2beta)/eIF-5